MCIGMQANWATGPLAREERESQSDNNHTNYSHAPTLVWPAASSRPVGLHHCGTSAAHTGVPAPCRAGTRRNGILLRPGRDRRWRSLHSWAGPGSISRSGALARIQVLRRLELARPHLIAPAILEHQPQQWVGLGKCRAIRDARPHLQRTWMLRIGNDTPLLDLVCVQLPVGGQAHTQCAVDSHHGAPN